MWIATRSSYRVTAQKPALVPGSGCQATGASCRNRRNHSKGTPSTKLSGSARSIPSRTAVTKAPSEERGVVVELPGRRLRGRRVVHGLGVALPLRELELREGVDERRAQRVAHPFVAAHRLDGGLERRGHVIAGRLRRDDLGGRHRHRVLGAEPAGVQERRRREVRFTRAGWNAVLEPGGVSTVGTYAD